MSLFDVVYLSPHADDVAFSAVGQLARDVADGKRVALLTLFCPAATDHGAQPFGDRAARAAEDRAFAEQMKVTLVDGGLPEGPARAPRFGRARVLLAPLPDDDEQETVAAVQQKIAALCGPHTELVAPVSIGCHVDHQVVQRAVMQFVDAGRGVRFYEDVPYVLVPYALPRRFAQLGWNRGASSGSAPKRGIGDEAPLNDTTFERADFVRELGRAAAHFARLPFLRQAAPLPFAAVAAATMVYRDVRGRVRPPLRTATASLFVDGALAATKRRAAALYDSQWRLFFPSLDAYEAQLSAYGQKMGCGLVERSWTLAPALRRRC